MYYRDGFSDDVHGGSANGTSAIIFWLVALGVAIVAFRAVYLFGLDLPATIQSLTSALQ